MKVSTIHRIANILRELKLLQFIDYLHYIKDLAENRKINRAFLAKNPSVLPPPSALIFDSYGCNNIQKYFESGVNDAKDIAELINNHINKTGDECNILEWGCGTARVARHLEKFLDRNNKSNISVYGSDYNSLSIEWCKNHIQNITFDANKLMPPFKYASNTFDCVYAISVFTHLSKEMHFKWIEEMERVIKTTGILIFTTHGVKASDRLYGDEKKLFDTGELVVRGSVSEGKKWYLAYHPEKFIINELLKNWTIKKRGIFHLQDVWVVEKNSTM